jgi:hypothetical protein
MLKRSNWDIKIVAVVDRWSLFGGLILFDFKTKSDTSLQLQYLSQTCTSLTRLNIVMIVWF